jgi:DNA-binding MarR family transcriptional regulator
MSVQSSNDFAAGVSRLHTLILREMGRRKNSMMIKNAPPVSHILVIDILREHGMCTMGELAKSLNLTMSAATAIIDKMIEHNLVKRERSLEDRRVVRVGLLKIGTDLAKKIDKERMEAFVDMFADFSGAEKEEYSRLLKKVYENMKNASV